MAEAGQFGDPEYELTGGALCLDFANTSPDHKAPEPAPDKIRGYADMLAFDVQTGVLSVADARKLLLAANHSASKAEAVLRKTREVREVIYRVFAAMATSRKPSREDIESMNESLVEASRHSRLIARNGGFIRAWEDSGALDRPLWPIILSAAELLTSEELGQVRQCNSDRCSWLFVDRSRNGTRRWCDMKICGNRAKARRHYKRVKS